MINISKLTQLKQLPFNANNDNLIRVLCDIMQEVVDTTNALTGELITNVSLVRDSNDNVCIQLTKENDETIQSPAYGIEMWETLDLSSLPTNFAEGQELMITLLPTADAFTGTAWATAPTDNPTMSNKALQNTVRVRLTTGLPQGSMLTSIKVEQNGISGVELIVDDVTYWNGTGGTEIFMQLIPFVFNGGNVQEGTGVSIMRNNVSQYIESIKRKL